MESEEEDSQLAEKRQALPGEIAPNENAELGQWFENPVTEDRDEMAEEGNTSSLTMAIIKPLISKL